MEFFAPPNPLAVRAVSCLCTGAGMLLADKYDLQEQLKLSLLQIEDKELNSGSTSSPRTATPWGRRRRSSQALSSPPSSRLC